MPRFFVKTNQIQDDTIKILGEDVNHIKNVLRKNVNSEIDICNQDNGKAYHCKIFNIKDDEILCNIIEEIKKQENKIKVDIYQGLPKSDKMEFIIQKSVELGANSIIPVRMARCVVKIDKKDEKKKLERWNKISESAAKQCGRSYIPEVKPIIEIKDIKNLKDAYDEIIVAYENEKENYIKKELTKLKELKQELKIAILIGPEGGLDKNEVMLLKENSANIVTLGNRILRTETVALNMLSIIMYELEDENIKYKE